MMKSKPLIFFGNERLASAVRVPGTILFVGLLGAGYDIAALVLASANEPRDKRQTTEVETTANKHGIPVMRGPSDEEIIELVKSSDTEVGVLAAYGRIVSEDVISAFSRGIINVHPSLLPLYRGATPIEAALLDGAEQTGVTLMGLVKAMDAGPIYDQKMYELAPDASKQQVFEDLSRLGLEMLLSKLPPIIDGTAETSMQDDSGATYTKKLSSESGRIDWQQPAQDIYNQVRAYLGWPGSKTKLAGREVIITECSTTEKSGHVGEHFIDDSGDLGIYCGKNALIINRLKVAGKSEMDGHSFINGYLNRT